MNPTEQKAKQALKLLLRAGLYGDRQLALSAVPLTESEWQAVYTLSVRQTVSGIVAEALGYLPDDMLPPESLSLRWMMRVHRIEEAYALMDSTLVSLNSFFSSQGLRPLLQKGHSVARFYPKPSIRVCGDIDLCFPVDKLRADRAMAEHLSSPLHHAADGSSSYRFKGIEVEHHSEPIELHSPFHRRHLRRLLAEEGTRPFLLSDGSSIDVLAPLPDLLMINVHIMKHCLGVGIGLRHFCDYIMAYRALIPEIGEKRYLRACRRLGIMRWTRVLHTFIDTYLADPSGRPFSSVTPTSFSRSVISRLAVKVYEGGNFGLFRNNSHGDPSNRRKIDTLSLFMRHLGLSLRLAPAESIGLITRLTRGQIGNTSF